MAYGSFPPKIFKAQIVINRLQEKVTTLLFFPVSLFESDVLTVNAPI